MNPLETLKAKLADRSTVIGIVGRGYVGLPVSLRSALSHHITASVKMSTGKIGRAHV